MHEHAIVAGLGVATGLVLAFMAWTYVGPMLTTTK